MRVCQNNENAEHALETAGFWLSVLPLDFSLLIVSSPVSQLDQGLIAYMKYILLFFVSIFSLSVADGQPNEISPAQSSELRKEHEEKRDKNGKVNVYIDTVFRGNVKVMLTITLLTKTKSGIKMTRGYFANGKNVVDEIHYEDGTQVIRLFKDDVLCEMFRRQRDGSVEPVSSEELAKLKGQQQELMETLNK